MSVELMLLPLYLDQGAPDPAHDHGVCFSRTVLPLGGIDYDLWTAIKALPAVPVPASFMAYVATGTDGDTTFGSLTEDSYGTPLMAVTVADLLALTEHPDVRESALCRPAWAYLAALPPRARVALFWH